MALESQGAGTGMRVSPGGFEFGLQGWEWGEPRIKSITFFLDNTAMVSDQHGRPIRGAEVNGKKYLFANCGPTIDEGKDYYIPRPGLATHAQVIEVIEHEKVEWQSLTCAGWPQLPYASLKKIMDAGKLALTPEDDLKKIRDTSLRRDALRARREANEALEKDRQQRQEE